MSLETEVATVHKTAEEILPLVDHFRVLVITEMQRRIDPNNHVAIAADGETIREICRALADAQYRCYIPQEVKPLYVRAARHAGTARCNICGMIRPSVHEAVLDLAEMVLGIAAASMVDDDGPVEFCPSSDLMAALDNPFTQKIVGRIYTTAAECAEVQFDADDSPRWLAHVQTELAVEYDSILERLADADSDDPKQPKLRTRRYAPPACPKCGKGSKVVKKYDGDIRVVRCQECGHKWTTTQ